MPHLLRRGAPHYAQPKTLRRRGLRVLRLGPWMLVYTPRRHWSRHL